MISIPIFARQSLLAILCGGAIGILVNSIVSNPSKSTLSAPAAFDFPQNITLPDASMLSSKQLPPHSFKNGMVATGKSYRYQNKPQPIEMEIRYITDGVANRPTVDGMLETFTAIPNTVIVPTTIKERPDVGFYSVFVHQKKAYFSTCINPQGITTVTGDQFHENSDPRPFSRGLPVDRFLPWLLGRQTLRDSRCLWTLLSTPIDAATPDATMKTLETVGVNWIRWWQVHFPAA